MGYLLSCQKSHWEAGAENYLLQTSMDEEEKSIYHHLDVVVFRVGSMYSEEPIMAYCLLMATAMDSCTGKSQWTCVCVY